MIATFLANLTSPQLLFFFLGAAAVAARSDLDIPNQIAKFLSLYLLFAIGFKGGVALAEASFGMHVMLTLGAAMVLSALVPLYSFFFIYKKLGVTNAAAVAATYGSVSAVTFVTAIGYLDQQGVEWGGHMVAAMALMESPAIIVGLLLYRKMATGDDALSGSFSWGHLLREACFNSSVFLILGSMLIGLISGPAGMSQVSGFIVDLFPGILCLFLLDMGIVAARRLRDLSNGSGEDALPWTFMVAAAVLLPLLNAVVALIMTSALGLNEGDAFLLLVLAASASYIAVPAAMRMVLPEANPGTYLPMSLAMTFPFNLLVGLPLYHAMVRAIA